jgi:CubicO group peptidase (beta-lactamase class C family)
MNRLLRSSLLLVLVPALAAARARAAEAPVVDPASVGMDAARLAEIPKRMAVFVEKKQAAGIVTLVARRDKIVALDAVGLADIEGNKPMRPDTLFWIASMTKPVAATAFMILVDEGKVNVDDPVAKYIPEFKDVRHKDGKAPAAVITIRHLLTHTSGVGSPGPAANRRDVTLFEFAVECAKAPLLFEPGSRWQYGGLTNISIVGAILEKVSGKKFDAFVQERLFDPLGMTDTGFYPSPAQRARIARIYRPAKQAGKDAPKDAPVRLEAMTSPFVNAEEADRVRYPNPSGGLFSSACDLSRFYAMVLAGGELGGKRILSDKAVRRMTDIATGELTAGFVPNSAWGLGWGIVRSPSGVAKSLSAGTYGHGGAYGTQGWVDPKTGVIYVLLVARSGFGNSDGADMRGTLHDLAAAAIRK